MHCFSPLSHHLLPSFHLILKAEPWMNSSAPRSVAEWWFIEQFTPSLICWGRLCLFSVCVLEIERDWQRVGEFWDLVPGPLVIELPIHTAVRWGWMPTAAWCSVVLQEGCVLQWLVPWLISFEVAIWSSCSTHPPNILLLKRLLYPHFLTLFVFHTKPKKYLWFLVPNRTHLNIIVTTLWDR